MIIANDWKAIHKIHLEWAKWKKIILFWTCGQHIHEKKPVKKLECGKTVREKINKKCTPWAKHKLKEVMLDTRVIMTQESPKVWRTMESPHLWADGVMTECSCVDTQEIEYWVKQGAYRYCIDTTIGQLAPLIFWWLKFQAEDIDAVVTQEDSIPAALALGLTSQPVDS